MTSIKMRASALSVVFDAIMLINDYIAIVSNSSFTSAVISNIQLIYSFHDITQLSMNDVMCGPVPGQERLAHEERRDDGHVNAGAAPA